MKLIFATSNKGKMREAGEIVGPSYEMLFSAEVGITEDIPETGSSFRENALQKAMYIWDRRFRLRILSASSFMRVPIFFVTLSQTV